MNKIFSNPAANANSIMIDGIFKTPYDMTNTDAIKVCRHVVSSVSEICKQINFVASESVSDACGKKPTLDGPDGFGKNQLNFANAYANKVLNGNYTADYNVTSACQALGCLDSAKEWLEIK